MSWDDKGFMERGFYVRHLYKRRRGRLSKCERCGTKRRHTSSGWEYQRSPREIWLTSNPACAKRRSPGGTKGGT